MAKESPLLVKISDTIIVWSLYLVVFLMPIFFIPFSSDFLDFNKQALLMLATFIALFAWMAKAIFSGGFTISKDKTSMAVGALVVVALLSALFSVNRYGSFWGWPLVTSESFLSIFCFATIFFLVSTHFSEKEISHAFLLVAISSLLAQVFTILQLAGLHIVPVSFAAATAFNTIGSFGSVGLFAVSMLPMFVVLAVLSQKWWKALFIANIIAVFVLTLLINYNFIWYGLLVSSLVLLVCWTIRRDIFDARWMFLPMFFLIVALFFIILSPQLQWLPQNSVEVTLSHKATLNIDMQALRKSPLLGSGPGTFSYDFSKFKDVNFNKNPLWNINFSSGSSHILNALATLGVLGFVAWLLVLALPLWRGAKTLLFERGKQDPIKSSLLLALFSMAAVQCFLSFFYISNMSLMTMLFLAIGGIIALVAKQERVYALKSSSWLMLGTTFLFTALFIFGLGFLMLEGQRYYADAYYYQGVKAATQGQRANGIALMKTAASNNSSLDIYFNQLATTSLALVQERVAKPDASLSAEAQKQMLESLVSDSIGAANIAVSINPNNIENWSTKGYVCQNLVGLNKDAVDCAIDAYDKAIALGPVNPYLYVQEGNVYAAAAVSLPKEQQAPKNDFLNKAIEKYQKAIELKEDYSLAYLQVALATRGKSDAAAEATALENAVRYQGKDASMMLQIGLVYYQDKNWDKAQQQFQAALGVNQNYANALYFSGLTYSQQGKNDTAISQLEKVLQLNPGNQNVEKILANLRAGRPALDGLVTQPPVPETTDSVAPKQ